MAWISLLGILVSIALFVFLCFKGIRVFVATILVSIIVILSSGLNPLETLQASYMPAMSNFLMKYLLLFILSALFGKVMEDSGSVRKIAQSLSALTKKTKHPKFWASMSLPIFYLLLSYVGISGFTIIFTVLAIGYALFKELDVPWLMYPYGSAGIMWAICLGGNIYNTNIVASNGFGTSLYAAMGMSIVCFIVFGIVLALCAMWDLKKYEKRGEGFLPSGQPMLENEPKLSLSSAELPHLILAILPLLAPIAMLAIFKVDVLVSMLTAILLCIALNFKRIKNIKEMINTGCTSAIMPMINVCGAVGFVSVIKLTAGYALVLDALYKLPPLLSALSLGMIMSSVVGSSISALGPIIDDLVKMYASAGVGPEAATRLTTMSVNAYMVPHNSGVVNALSLNKLNFAKGAWVYFKSTFIPGFCALLAGVLMVKLGLV